MPLLHHRATERARSVAAGSPVMFGQRAALGQRSAVNSGWISNGKGGYPLIRWCIDPFVSLHRFVYLGLPTPRQYYRKTNPVVRDDTWTCRRSIWILFVRDLRQQGARLRNSYSMAAVGNGRISTPTL